MLGLIACLLAPAAASAKGGVIFDRYPDVQAIGSPMKFTLMLYNRQGVRPLVTFRSRGSVVRVRASRSDLNGIAYGTVRLPSHGPWETEIAVGGRVVMEGDAEPFRVGVGLTETIPSANEERARVPAAKTDATAAVPWLALAAGAAVASGLALALIRRRRRWGAA